MIRRLILLAILLSGTAGHLAARSDFGKDTDRADVNASVQNDAPDFKGYRVPEDFKGTPAAPKLITRESRQFRTMIRDGAKAGPNFAGHFTIAQWGCGAGCVQFAIIDARTGAVYNPKFYVAQEFETRDEPLQYERGSRLLIVTGNRNEEEKEGVYYYVWQAGDLKLIKTLPVKHDKKADDN